MNRFEPNVRPSPLIGNPSETLSVLFGLPQQYGVLCRPGIHVFYCMFFSFTAFISPLRWQRLVTLSSNEPDC
jgi:hypothetical protein